MSANVTNSDSERRMAEVQGEDNVRNYINNVCDEGPIDPMKMF